MLDLGDSAGYSCSAPFAIALDGNLDGNAWHVLGKSSMLLAISVLDIKSSPARREIDTVASWSSAIMKRQFQESSDAKLSPMAPESHSSYRLLFKVLFFIFHFFSSCDICL